MPATVLSRQPPRGRLFSAAAVVLATVGCAPPGPRAAAGATDALRVDWPAAGLPAAPLSVLRAGDPRGPRLILVHGTPGSAEAWADYLLTPPPGLEVVAPDRPGFGRSGPDDALPALADQAAAVRALLPDDGRPAILLGHSLGGPVVARVAADAPGRVAALVLLSASLDPALETVHPLQRVGEWPPVRALLPRAIRNANRELLALRADLETLAGALPAVRAPVLIVHGDGDDLVPAANVAFMQAHLRGARCVETRMLPGANHFLPWNAEAEVRRAIARAAQMAAAPAC